MLMLTIARRRQSSKRRAWAIFLKSWLAYAPASLNLRVHGHGAVASALTNRAALAVGRLSHPLITRLVSFFTPAEPP